MYRIFVCFLVLTPLVGVSQSTFHLTSTWKTESIIVNGKEYLIDSMGVDIETHYPDFDTLKFLRFPESDILCNFKPNQYYSLTGACCGTLDIIPEEKHKALLKNYAWIEDDFLDMERVKEYTCDYPTFSVELTDENEDSIFFWSADYVCETNIIEATTEVKDYGVAYKCFYWSNITTLQFYTYPQPQETVEYEGNRYHYLPDFEKIGNEGSIRVRLFDDHHFRVTFDPTTCEIYLRYDD